jgi:ABC-2 type transport system permease protein
MSTGAGSDRGEPLSAAPGPVAAAGPVPPLAVTGALVGFRTLLFKELLRFWKVSVQTIAAPVLTAMLYLLVFSQALGGRVDVFPGVSYLSFLIPGLVMMSVLQNAFANSSSSLIQSKVTGNLVFVLLPPLSPLEIYGAYAIAAVVRGLTVGLGVLLITGWWGELQFHAPMWILAFAVLGSAILGTMGLIGGIWAEKFDQIAMFQNFLIMPATFLAGVFYSVHSLPAFWQTVSHLNPFFYMVDGFRYGFFGQSDVPPSISLAIVVATLALASGVALQMLRSGFRLRH